MKLRIVVLLLAIMSCTPTASDQPPLPVPPPLPETQPAPPTIAPPVLARTIVQHFDVAKAREMSVVLGDEITKRQIENIRATDLRARRALTNLGNQIRRPTAAAMIEAREAVQALEDALSER